MLFSIQSWLSETPAQKAVASSPAYLQVGMAALSLAVGTYRLSFIHPELILLPASTRHTAFANSPSVLSYSSPLIPSVYMIHADTRVLTNRVHASFHASRRRIWPGRRQRHRSSCTKPVGGSLSDSLYTHDIDNPATILASSR